MKNYDVMYVTFIIDVRNFTVILEKMYVTVNISVETLTNWCNDEPSSIDLDKLLVFKSILTIILNAFKRSVRCRVLAK